MTGEPGEDRDGIPHLRREEKKQQISQPKGNRSAGEKLRERRRKNVLAAPTRPDHRVFNSKIGVQHIADVRPKRGGGEKRLPDTWGGGRGFTSWVKKKTSFLVYTGDSVT